jgi:carbonic anhydrase/acetyltransferase-like protein (isoleucine patch superfamily)
MFMALYALNKTEPEMSDPDRVWVAPDAHVIGWAKLGLDVSVWFGAVIRGDNDLITIGDGSNVQDGAVLHADAGFPLLVGANVTIGHRAIVHGCTIGDNSLIGMGATVLNGAVIGRNSLVGANALITEGKVYPERSLIVGAPARAIRSILDEDVGDILKVAQHYVKNSILYRGNLRRLDAER